MKGENKALERKLEEVFVYASKVYFYWRRKGKSHEEAVKAATKGVLGLLEYKNIPIKEFIEYLAVTKKILDNFIKKVEEELKE